MPTRTERKPIPVWGKPIFTRVRSRQPQQAFEQAIRHYLLKGRRDLAKQVKEQADALFPPASETKE